MKKIVFPVLMLVLAVAVSACAQKRQTYYWQKKETHSALYLQGPKAQQQLEEDIARCVAEIHELVRQGAVRKTLPEDVSRKGDSIIAKESRDAYWNVPQRYGARYVDHSDYHDFDSCMDYRGWVRVKYAPYDQIAVSNTSYERLMNDRMDRQENLYIERDRPSNLAGQSGPYYHHVND